MASGANERLCGAAMLGDVAGIAAALLAGADPNAFEGTDSLTPLRCAARNGHVAAIAALLAAGAHVDGRDILGGTPLMYAADRGHTAALDALLAAGADVNHTGIHGDIALHWASNAGCLDAARVLLVAGARTDVCTKRGQRPIDEVRAPTRSLRVASRSRHPAALPRRFTQIRWNGGAFKAAIRALFASTAPWSRRRPVALACYAVELEWEA
jgi:ankyrin repeat protein